METSCESKISSAVVYVDRARITRIAEIVIGGEETLVVFKGLPKEIDRRSVRLTGAAGMLLRDVQVETVVTGGPTVGERKRFEDELQALRDKASEMDDRKTQLEGEKAFVERIADRLTGEQGKPGPNEFSPENWIRMVDFYRDRLATLGGSLRALVVERRELDKLARDAKERLANAGGVPERSETRVQARLVGGQAGSKVALALEYLVMGPSWEPSYELRASPSEGIVRVVYGARVAQGTGEDWPDVELSLSTAPVNEGGDAPEIEPVRVGLWVPPPPPVMLAAMRSAAPSPAMAKRVAEVAESMEAYASEAAYAPPEVEKAEVREGAVSAEFVIAGRIGVPSSGGPKSVTIAEFPIPAEYSRTIVPCLAEKAYLAAKAKNDSDYPMLEGSAFVFLDGAFVGESTVEFTPPGASLELSLGIDAGCEVEYRVLRDFGSQQGIVAKKERTLYDRLIVVKNRGKKDLNCRILDRVPVSDNQDVVVRLEEPQYKKETSELSMDERGLLTWKMFVPAGREIEIPFRYSVERPSGSRLEWK